MKKMSLKKVLATSALALLPALAPVVATAGDYPSRPVKFIVPWPPGDIEDVLTRMIAENMAKETKVPATVVNKPGGGGVLGASTVAQARPDGLTIGSFVVDLVTTQVQGGNAPYDKDAFEPVGIFLDYPFVLAVKADAPYNNMAELAEYSKNNKVSLGHFGYQALPTAVTFKSADMLGVKFSSDAPFDALDCSTLANGDADVINTNTQLILACLNSGEAKVIASITSDRISIVPDVPTMAEQGGLTTTLWNGLFVKKGTPADIKAKIAAIAEKTVMSEKAQEINKNTGAGIYWKGAEEAAEVIKTDYEASLGLAEYMK